MQQPDGALDERQFYVELRRALLIVVRAIEARYRLKENAQT